VVAAAGLGVLLLAAYFATSRWMPPTNPTVIAALTTNRYDFINPVWMLKTLAYFPMLAALWFLLLVPGAGTVGVRWRLLPPATPVIAMLGLWFAAAGMGLMTWLYARHTGLYVLTLALVLALPAPAEWLRRAERPVMLFAAICAVAAVSYNVDLFLFGRFVDRNLSPGVIDAARRRPPRCPPGSPNPPRHAFSSNMRREKTMSTTWLCLPTIGFA
jgi:hypothetical protein